MPSFQDSAVIFVIALLLFGPKKLPELARQLGKLMGEFRRASNDFKMQMEDELRMSEQAERQKEIAAMQAAAPVADATPALAAPVYEYPAEEHPHLPSATPAEVLPIATSGDLSMMPPSSGLPVARGAGAGRGGDGFGGDGQEALGPLLEAIPEGVPGAPARHTGEFVEHSISGVNGAGVNGSGAEHHG